jgi:uracil-DNA glycosylase
MYFKDETYQAMTKTLKDIYQKEAVNPPFKDVFKAFELTPFERVKVVLIGQDPYPNPFDAMGLAFSVPKERPLPASLKNIFKVLKKDLDISPPHGDLSGWAKEGVLLLNKALTVKAHQPLSHVDLWDDFFKEVIDHLNQKEKLVFVLMGNEAQKIKSWIHPRHKIIMTVHPSPLSAYRGFFDSQLFIKINQALKELALSPVDFECFD